MLHSDNSHRLTKIVIDILLVIVIHLHVSLYLVVKLGHKISTNGQVYWPSQSSQIDHPQ